MLVYFAIMLIGLLGFSGLVVDVGRIELRSLQLQAAADSAALSAAAEYQRTANLTTATNAAKSELASYASLNGVTAPTPTVTLGAATGYYKGDGSTLQVSVVQPISTTMLSLIKGSGSTINASATAVAMIPPCIYLMGHPSLPSFGNNNLALRSQGFTLTCPMYSSTGYYVDGFSYIRNWQAKSLGPASQTYGGGWESPVVLYNSPALADPLAYVVAPSFSSCPPANTNQTITTPKTLVAGTYCNLTISGTGANVTLSPGLYVIAGGMTITNGATVTGSGVTIYLTKGGSFNSYVGFSLTNGPAGIASTMNVSAPTDGSNGGRAAILMMTDRNWVGTSQDISFNQSTFKGDGLFYITGTGIYNWQTPMSGYNYFGFVAANFTFTRSTLTFSCDYSQLPGGNPFRTVISLVQ